MSSKKKSIGEILRDQRERRGLTQVELAAKAELTPAAISHFETGLRVPSPRNLAKLADALEVTADHLLGRQVAPQATGGSMEVIFRNAQSLSSESLEVLKNLTQSLADIDRKKKGTGGDTKT